MPYGSTLFLLFFSLPILIVNWQFFGFTAPLPVIILALSMLVLVLSILVRRELKIPFSSIFIISVFPGLLLLLSIFQFYFGVLMHGNNFSIELFLGNFIQLFIGFLLIILVILLINFIGLRRGVSASLFGAISVGAFSSIYGITAQVLLFSGFDLAAFLAETFNFIDAERSLGWSVQGLYRASGFAGINASAIYYSMLTPCAWYFATAPNNIFSDKFKWFFRLCLLLLLLGTLSSFSRVAWAVTFLFFAFIFIRRLYLKSVFFILIAVGITFSMVGPSFIDMLLELGEVRLHLSSNRFLLWSGGLALIDSFPFGVGLGQYYNYAQIEFQNEELYDLNLHNSWLDLLVTHGALVLITSSIVLFFLIFRLQKSPDVGPYLGSGLFLACIAGFGNSVFGMFYFFGFFALCISYITLSEYTGSLEESAVEANYQ